jgi:hypothetical protein
LPRSAEMEKYRGKKWLHINAETTFKKAVRCTKTTDFINLGIFYTRLDARSSTTKENKEGKTRLS